MDHPEIQRILRRYRHLAAMALGLSIDEKQLLETWEEVTAHCHCQIQEFLNDPIWPKNPDVIRAAEEAIRIMDGDMTWLSEGLMRHEFLGRCQ